MQGKIFSIQHFSTQDGPGVRSVIFFKGCNLSCKWCHNPESLSFDTEMMFYKEKCISCGNCIDLCKHKCHQLDSDETHIYDHRNCHKCFDCANHCYSNALQQVGEDVSLEYLMNEIISQKPYFENSNGGVTFSGGECMLQIEFLSELLKRCKENDIHTAVDTAGHVEYASFKKIISYTDLFLYDLKAIDNDLHQELTGVSNLKIIENFEKLLSDGANVHVKVPYIPNYNEVDMDNMGAFLKPYHVKKFLLPYHTFGVIKYQALGLKYSEGQSVSKTDEQFNKIKEKYNYE